MGLDSAPALELSGVSKSYDSFQAVKPLDLVVPRGATYGLLGPNGAGKTTTLRMLYGVMRPDAGSIRIDSVDAVASPHLRHRCVCRCLVERCLLGRGERTDRCIAQAQRGQTFERARRGERDLPHPQRGGGVAVGRPPPSWTRSTRARRGGRACVRARRTSSPRWSG